MNDMTPFPPFGTDFDIGAGVMKNPDRRIERRASSMRGHYQDSAALEALIRDKGDPLHYEVFEKNVPEEYGHLRIAVSKLQSGTVGEECFMTKGHYHEVVETAEISLCIYPGEAGHNYGDIEKQGFPKRIFKDDENVKIVASE